MDDLVKQSVSEVKNLLKDPKNKHAVIASTIAWYLSNENKERNAIVAGLLAYTFLPDGDKVEELGAEVEENE